MLQSMPFIQRESPEAGQASQHKLNQRNYSVLHYPPPLQEISGELSIKKAIKQHRVSPL
jgi:hypothetical protein